MTPEKHAALARRFPCTELLDADGKPRGLVRLAPARLSFPALFEPKQYKGEGKLRYSATALMAVGDDARALELVCRRVVAQGLGGTCKFGPVAHGKRVVECTTAGSKAARVTLDWPILDQGDRDQPGYNPGALYVAAYAYRKPFTVAADHRLAITDPAVLYAGCYVAITLNPYWSKAFSRLCIGLEGVQKLADGERFGGGASSPDELFDDMSAEFGDDSMADFDSPALDPTLA